jgi:hypothetical protein
VVFDVSGLAIDDPRTVRHFAGRLGVMSDPEAALVAPDRVRRQVLRLCGAGAPPLFDSTGEAVDAMGRGLTS